MTWLLTITVLAFILWLFAIHLVLGAKARKNRADAAASAARELLQQEQEQEQAEREPEQKEEGRRKNFPPWSWESLSNAINEASDSSAGDVNAENRVANFLVGDDYSALVGGGIGSGKSTLLHNIICNTVRTYSPDEVELILLDFKEGTEFSVYARLPHVKVLATASDITLGVSALNFIADEIKRRGAIFKKHGRKNFKEYRSSSNDKMPRWLVIIDEFQSLFYDHATARQVEPLLDNLVRKGRAFGIHFVLSTQSLLGVNISESTLSQLGIRIALRMSERDAARFLSADNTLPATFTVPGRAVYNANHGLTESNSIIQVFPIGRELINHVVDLAASKYPVPDARFILDGSSFAVLPEQRKILDPANHGNSKAIVFEPGVPLDLSGAKVVLRFDRRQPERLCVLGYDEAKWLAILRSWCLQISGMHERAKFTIFDFSGVFDGFRPTLVGNAEWRIYGDDKEIEEKIIEIADRLSGEHKAQGACDEFLCFIDIGAARMLRRKRFDPITRQESDNPLKAKVVEILNFGPSAQLQITVFSKRAVQIEEVLQTEYDKPVRASQFDYQIILDANELPDFNAQTLSEHNAYVMDNVVGETKKIILYDTEGAENEIQY